MMPNTNLLTLDDIQRALAQFPSYHSICVFHVGVVGAGPFSARMGVFERGREPMWRPPREVREFGKILALLVGESIGEPTNCNRRILPLQFDTRTREWSAYDSGLVSWMKEQLLGWSEP